MANSLGGFMSGFEQGYGFMQNLADRRADREYRSKRLDINEQQRAIENKRAEAKAAWLEQQHELKRENLRLQKRARIAKGLNYYANHGGILPDRWDALANEFGMPSLQHLNSPEFGQAIQDSKSIGEGKIDYRDPQANDTLNTLFGHSVNKGAGEINSAGQIIVSKKLVGRPYPSPDGSGVMHDLDVKAYDLNIGDNVHYSAPMTKGRDSAPGTHVMVTPPEKYMEAAQGAQISRALAQAVATGDIKTQKAITGAMVASLGGNPNAFRTQPKGPQWGPAQQIGNRWVQRNKITGAYREMPWNAYGMQAPAIKPSGPGLIQPISDSQERLRYGDVNEQINSGLGIGQAFNPLTGKVTSFGNSTARRYAPILHTVADRAIQADGFKRPPAFYSNKILRAYDRANPKSNDELRMAAEAEAKKAGAGGDKKWIAQRLQVLKHERDKKLRMALSRAFSPRKKRNGKRIQTRRRNNRSEPTASQDPLGIRP